MLAALAAELVAAPLDLDVLAELVAIIWIATPRVARIGQLWP